MNERLYKSTIEKQRHVEIHYTAFENSRGSNSIGKRGAISGKEIILTLFSNTEKDFDHINSTY